MIILGDLKAFYRAIDKTWYGKKLPNLPKSAKQVRFEEIIQPKINAIMRFTVLIGLLITGYVMIALLVMSHNALINIQNKLNNYELLYKQVYINCR